MVTVTVQQALQMIADDPTVGDRAPIDMKVYELVAGALFDIANKPDKRVRGSMARATRAQKIIMNRLVGTRRPGSHPATQKGSELEFFDLTAGVLE